MGALDVFEVPGDHDSMVLEPNVRVLARKLREVIDAAESRLPQRAADGLPRGGVKRCELLCVILNYRTPAMTIDATRAARTALARVGEHRIDVVDNDSQDGSYDALCLAAATECWDDVQVLQTGHNGGFGFGNNYAHPSRNWNRTTRQTSSTS